eukprot:gene27296-33616_t
MTAPRVPGEVLGLIGLGNARDEGGEYWGLIGPGNEATVPAGRMTDTAMNSIFGAAKRPSKAFVDAGVVPALKEKAQGWDVAPEPKLEVSTGISSLAEILHTVEGDQRMGSALSVRVLACKGREMQDELVSKGVLGPLVDMLTKCSPPGQAAAAGAIQKIVSHHKENQ